jgi:hypothetical protein
MIPWQSKMLTANFASKISPGGFSSALSLVEWAEMDLRNVCPLRIVVTFFIKGNTSGTLMVN